MCIMSSPSIPAPPPAPEPPKEAPKRADPATQQARQDERKRVQQLAGAASLQKTGPGGLTTTANTNVKTALGA